MTCQGTTGTFAPSRRLVVGAALAMAAAPGASAAAFAPRIRRLAPHFDRFVSPDARIEVVATGIRWAEGPVWVDAGGYLLFSDPPANVVRRWRPGGRATPFLTPSGLANPDPTITREPGANGLAIDRRGRLLIANSGGRSIDRLDLETMTREVLVDRFEGKRFNSPNDLHVARDGTIYFTDPPYGLQDPDTSAAREMSVNGVYRRGADGTVTLIDDSLTRPNGIALSPDEHRLYVSVSDETAPRILVYDLDERGRPSRSRVLLDARPMQGPEAPGLPDGMKIARDGTLVCSVPGGMMFLSPDAEPLGLISIGAPIANCAFGEHGGALYLAASDRILRLPLKHMG